MNAVCSDSPVVPFQVGARFSATTFTFSVRRTTRPGDLFGGLDMDTVFGTLRASEGISPHRKGMVYFEVLSSTKVLTTLASLYAIHQIRSSTCYPAKGPPCHPQPTTSPLGCRRRRRRLVQVCEPQQHDPISPQFHDAGTREVWLTRFESE